MKKLLFILAALTLTVSAGNIKLGWDYPTGTMVTEFRLYEINGATNNLVAKVVSATARTISADFAAGTHQVYLTAATSEGLESGPSNVLILGVPIPPTTLRIVVTP